MKKMIKLLSFLFLFSVCYSNTMAQTKQESLEWFHAYGKALVNVPPDSIPATKRIDIKKDTLYVFSQTDGFVSDRDDYRVALKDIKYQDIVKLVPDHEEMGYKLFKIKCGSKKVIYTSEFFTKISVDAVDEVEFWYTDEADAKRILKCIMHLAKLCGAKPIKQVF